MNDRFDGDPDWMVESIDDDTVFTHVVSFSDVIAHQREDLVELSRTFLSSLDGVESVQQDDREAIAVQARVLSREIIESAFAEWWRTVRDSDPPWDELLKQVSAAVHRVLKPLGFKKRQHLFNRSVGEVIHVVELTRLNGNQVRPDVGVYLPGVSRLAFGHADRTGQWIGEPACQIRAPLGSGTTQFALTAGSQAVARHVAEVVVPALDRLVSHADILSEYEAGTDVSRFTNLGSVIASLYVLAGDVGAAQAVLQEQFDSAQPRSRPVVHATAGRLGLQPLTTSSDPNLSLADAELLDSWRTRQRNRLEQLEELLQDTPTPAGRFRRKTRLGGLDTSPRSRRYLWQWLVQQANRYNDIVDDPQPLPARYAGYSARHELGDAARVIGDLVGTYMFEAVRFEVAGLEWDIGPGGELVATNGSETEDVVSRGYQIVRWLLDPPKTVKDPARADLLSQRIDWLRAQLSQA